MTFDEFLEFLPRLAITAYKDKAHVKLPIHEKLDLLLLKLLGSIRVIKYPPYLPEDSSDDEDVTPR